MLDGYELIDVHMHAARLPTLKPAWKQWAHDFGGTEVIQRVYRPDGSEAVSVRSRKVRQA